LVEERELLVLVQIDSRQWHPAVAEDVAAAALEIVEVR
jgi:hypothetical protein